MSLLIIHYYSNWYFENVAQSYKYYFEIYALYSLKVVV